MCRVRWDASARAPRQADIDLAGRALLSSPLGQQDSAAARRSLVAMPRPRRTPVFGEIRVDRAAHVWVQRYPLPTDSTDAWWVFDPHGTLIATLDAPVGRQVLEIGDDHLIARATDEYDVQRIEVWPLVRDLTGREASASTCAAHTSG